MASVEVGATGASAWLASRSIRYFFVLIALFGIVIASIVFVPQILKFAAGTFPIAWVLNVHGALMTAWLALFFAQALLASTGRLALHRNLRCGKTPVIAARAETGLLETLRRCR
jgi:hypothetical protein